MTLSDKEQYVRNLEKHVGLLGFSTKDVKAFIKELKKKVKEVQDELEANYSYEDTVMSSYEVIEILDKLAGDKLI